MQNAIAYHASCFTFGTPGGSAAFCARLRLFALNPFWTNGLRQIHHCTRGSAPLSNRDKSLLLHIDRWTRSTFAIHPAAVEVSVVSDRALTPRLAGLRPYASLQSSSLCSLSASRDWAGRPTTERGGSRLVVTPLDGGRPHRTGMPGGHRFASPSFIRAWALVCRPFGCKLHSLGRACLQVSSSAERLRRNRTGQRTVGGASALSHVWT